MLNHELLEEIISFLDFKNCFLELLSKENIRYYAFKMLYSYEHYIQEGYRILNPQIQKSLQHKMRVLGPMNTKQDKYILYIMPQEHFFKDLNASKPPKSQIRFMDQNEFDRIDERIKSYKIIKTDRIDGSVDVLGYYDIKQDLTQKLRIALIPMAPVKWFKELYNPRENEINLLDDKKENINGIVDIVVADNEEDIDNINNAYINILEKCIQEKIQIVVFPEMARNRKTLLVIKKFLSEHMISGENSLQLIFLGSFWEEDSNNGILLNGSGTELLKIPKKYAYTKIKDGVMYREELINACDEISLIDIPGLGRIQYSICKDGLNAASQNNLWAIFEISFSVISAYSESLSHFTNLGGSFSTQFGGIQILANACSSRMERINAEECPVLEIGNVIMPCACGDDMSVCKAVQKYETMDYCWEECRKNQKIGNCIRVVSIYLDEASENETLIMSLDNIIL